MPNNTPRMLTIDEVSQISGGLDNGEKIVAAAAVAATAVAVVGLVVASGGLAAVPLMSAVGAGLAGGAVGGTAGILSQ